MKISILSFDLSMNCLGRAYILVKDLSRHYDVGTMDLLTPARRTPSGSMTDGWQFSSSRFGPVCPFFELVENRDPGYFLL